MLELKINMKLNLLKNAGVLLMQIARELQVVRKFGTHHE